jgi:uncharacterized protein
MNPWLVDTGPLVAYLDRRDPAHKRMAKLLGDFTGRILTTTAVVTEAMHFVSADSRGALRLADFIADSGAEVFDFCEAPKIQEAAKLMKKYPSVPMDFADATLLLLADAMNVREILTLDFRGFTIYRTPRGARLEIVE